jgi:short-subunit dehydrogenase
MRLREARVWLIGGSSGIGAALAQELARRGAVLALSARSRAGLDDVARRIRAAGGRAEVFPLDVTVQGAARSVAADVASSAPIDVLVYSAGEWTVTDVTAFDLAAVERQIATNLTGLARAVDAVLPGMLQRRRGAIVGIASVAGYRGLPRAEAYGATKAAAINFLESLRVDLAPRGVRVVTVSPGFVATPLTARNDFPMPFMVPAADAARTIADGMEGDRRYIEFPRRLGIPMKVLRLLPVALYDIAAGRLRR